MKKFDIFPLPEINYPLSTGTLGIDIVIGHEAEAHCNNPGCNHRGRVNLVALAKVLGPQHGSLAKDLKPHIHCPVCRKAGKPDRNIGFTMTAPKMHMCPIETRHDPHGRPLR